MDTVASPSGKTYAPDSGKAIPVHASHSARVPVISSDSGSGAPSPGANAFVDPHPGIEELSVFATPPNIALDRSQRVAVLPRRAHRRHQVLEPMALGEGAHRSEDIGGHAPTPASLGVSAARAQSVLTGAPDLRSWKMRSIVRSDPGHSPV